MLIVNITLLLSLRKQMALFLCILNSFHRDQLPSLIITKMTTNLGDYTSLCKISYMFSTRTQRRTEGTKWEFNSLRLQTLSMNIKKNHFPVPTMMDTSHHQTLPIGRDPTPLPHRYVDTMSLSSGHIHPINNAARNSLSMHLL